MAAIGASIAKMLYLQGFSRGLDFAKHGLRRSGA
jgi:hypothetical protein